MPFYWVAQETSTHGWAACGIMDGFLDGET
jgi:hypothetical protein